MSENNRDSGPTCAEVTGALDLRLGLDDPQAGQQLLQHPNRHRHHLLADAVAGYGAKRGQGRGSRVANSNPTKVKVPPTR